MSRGPRGLFDGAGEVFNRYIRAARMKKSIPSATVSAPVVSNENIMPLQPNMDCNYSSMPPPLMKMGPGDVGNNLSFYNL